MRQLLDCRQHHWQIESVLLHIARPAWAIFFARFFVIVFFAPAEVTISIFRKLTSCLNSRELSKARSVVRIFTSILSLLASLVCSLALRLVSRVSPKLLSHKHFSHNLGRPGEHHLARHSPLPSTGARVDRIPILLAAFLC